MAEWRVELRFSSPRAHSGPGAPLRPLLPQAGGTRRARLRRRGGIGSSQGATCGGDPRGGAADRAPGGRCGAAHARGAGQDLRHAGRPRGPAPADHRARRHRRPRQPDGARLQPLPHRPADAADGAADRQAGAGDGADPRRRAAPAPAPVRGADPGGPAGAAVREGRRQHLPRRHQRTVRRGAHRLPQAAEREGGARRPGARRRPLRKRRRPALQPRGQAWSACCWRWW